ncbi:unnamed protein product [Adineta steineri]|uniref:Uncharacterized protein n=1 Tax=Adineta steineri TaxID=433720 RepID=A0A814HAL2_9BILA|nr:unnamed protein product [Adineta steineri]CAF1007109.1 unnamed protein product [Adineta steineri]CAF1062637.1 unnamed protein product [Adineta steineri]CAF3665846.1 unnamed protein product [Adineta steineri]
MTSYISSSPTSTPELIKPKTYYKPYHIEIGIIILFLCLTIPSLIILTFVYRRQILPTSSSSSSSIHLSDQNFHRISLINYPQARCMDNSIASYYIRLANNRHSRWLIYFDGGWFCYSNESCEFRRQYSPDLITTKNINEKKFFSGIFSSFKQFNIIYAPYCSSDLWSGSSNKTSSHGYDIFHAIFHQQNYFSHAKQIIFTGFSAGGLGLLLNLPDLLPKISSHIDIRVLIDSAWFIDYSDNPNGISKINQGMAYWNTQISSLCQLESRYKCLLGSEAIKLLPLTVKIFIIQSLFDLTQLQLDKININSYNFTLKLRDNLRQSSNRISIFAPSCPLHGFLFRSVWTKFDIKQRTLASVLNLWLKKKKKFHLQLIDEHFYSSYCPQINDDYQEIF